MQSRNNMHSDKEQDVLGGTGGLQTMGILNALRTGDPWLDMILALSLPLLVRFLLHMAKRAQVYLLEMRLWAGTKEHERTIRHAKKRNHYGEMTNESSTQQNAILMKAIQLYLHECMQLNLRDADVDLTSTEDKNTSTDLKSAETERRRSYVVDYGRNSKNDSKTVVGALSKYKIIKKPQVRQWHKLGVHGKLKSALVRLLIDRHEVQDGNKTISQIHHLFIFRSQSGEAIDDFIKKAYSWYMGELVKLEDNSRYLYELTVKESDASDTSSDNKRHRDKIYTRYKLSDEKTFKSLFFRQKESLLKIIRHFEERSGKYAVEGYPHKLGLLLHGPPGSGKTSLIKALAQHTGRSIVNVPLARVSTNSELMSIFFDHRKCVVGESVPVELGFKDVIFVMEDVDAASKIVKRRTKMEPDGLRSQADTQDLPLPTPLWHMLLQSNEADCKRLVKVLLEESEELKFEANKPETIAAIAQKANSLPGLGIVGDSSDDLLLENIGNEAVKSANQIIQDQSVVDRFLAMHARVLLNMIENGTPVDKSLVDELLGKSSLRRLDLAANGTDRSSELPVASATPDVHAGSADNDAVLASFAKLVEGDKKLGSVVGAPLWNQPKDHLNLTGLLNVLDGVVDSPGRIVIMTTNHVDHLDPALIRPGRIDKRLLLGYMAALDVVAMVEHYFQLTLDDTQKARVEQAMTADQPSRRKTCLTPAQLEQLMAEYDTIEQMICALEAS